MNYIIHFTKCSDRTTLASAKIAKFLQDETGYFLIDNKDSLKAVTKIKTILIVNSPIAFCDFRLELIELLKNSCSEQTKIIWIQNDFAIAIPSLISKNCSITEVWTTIQNNPKMKYPVKYINWNAVTFKPIPNLKPIKERKQGLFYYGAYRQGRILDFKKYLDSDKYPVFVSASTQAIFKFSQEFPSAKCFKPFNSIKQIQDFSATLYIEDEYSHNIYTSPANRFYECLSAKVPMAFDVKTTGTFAKAGFKLQKNWIVNSKEDIKLFIKNSEKILTEQLQYFKDLFFIELKISLKKLIKEL